MPGGGLNWTKAAERDAGRRARFNSEPPARGSKTVEQDIILALCAETGVDVPKGLRSMSDVDAKCLIIQLEALARRQAEDA